MPADQRHRWIMRRHRQPRSTRSAALREVSGTHGGVFVAVKYVHPAAPMRELRTWFDGALRDRLPAAQPLYWT